MIKETLEKASNKEEWVKKFIFYVWLSIESKETFESYMVQHKIQKTTLLFNIMVPLRRDPIKRRQYSLS